MDMLLWRHAEALEPAEAQFDDLKRPLSPRGLKQAQRMAKWLDEHMPDGVRILSSPALRCETTVMTLKRKYKIYPELGPQADVASVLELVNWPHAKAPVLLVGHQPVLGQVIAQLLGWPEHGLSVRKGGVWWLRHRVRLDEYSTLVHCVQSPDLIW
jgi:phosphohistidine phosphatase